MQPILDWHHAAMARYHTYLPCLNLRLDDQLDLAGLRLLRKHLRVLLDVDDADGGVNHP